MALKCDYYSDTVVISNGAIPYDTYVCVSTEDIELLSNHKSVIACGDVLYLYWLKTNLRICVVIKHPHYFEKPPENITNEWMRENIVLDEVIEAIGKKVVETYRKLTPAQKAQFIYEQLRKTEKEVYE